MRKRSTPALRTAAPAAIAPHRIPVLRTMYIVAATLLFFFLNLYFIYVYVQNYSKDELVRSFEKSHLSQSKEDSQHIRSTPGINFHSCDISDQLALSALSRAKTESCRRKLQHEGFGRCRPHITQLLVLFRSMIVPRVYVNCPSSRIDQRNEYRPAVKWQLLVCTVHWNREEISDAACKLKNGLFHDSFPESQCVNHDRLLINFRVGCFEDSKSNRALNGFAYEFKSDNSMEKCRATCYRAGFIYYGLEFGRECFCGDSLAKQSIDEARCTEYRCTGNSSQYCGGFNAVEIFRTGLKEPHLMPKAKYVETADADVNTKRPRILFLLQLNGRNERQVKRLLKALYSPHHYYYIHVDQRQLYMLTEVKAVAAKLSNVYVAPDPHSTIWGGASLLTMVQDAIRRSIAMPSLSDWDYLINLSESDFPVLTLNELETQLRMNPGQSYMSSHGYNTARFIQKQGFDFVFIECENRMWRIGKRDEFPRNLRIDGGSDWIILHREFAEYSISDDELPRKMRALFGSIILPVESFFHTLSYNSHFCNSILGSNLRLTNWNRKQGCRCESLKKVVDWCGCSPLVFKKEHTHKFAIKNAQAKPFYIARKFESLIDIDAIALAEKQAMRDRPHLLHTDDVMFNVTFVNHYKADIDGYSLPFSMMAESLLSMYDKDAEFVSLLRIDAVKVHSSAPHQIIFTMQIRQSDVPLQLLVQRRLVSHIVSPAIVDGFKLESVMAGTEIDHKEEIFRGFTAYADVTSSPVVLLRWSRVTGMATTVNETKTSPPIRYLWRGPKEKLVATQKLRSYDSMYGGQFAALQLKNLNTSNLEAGMWSVVIQTDRGESPETIATVWLPIYSTDDKPLFQSLVGNFFIIQDSCSKTCFSTTWSTFHPDPKSDILVGYDKTVEALV
ncbi:hypothetical protein Y032_0240g3345 [Ancylostoma ceylanicum]|uniref:protein xylosyltransferase n=2 Tax=Ancylostoma ceylanicum TaxID=53326 RepID=A0A016SDT7_9BILA|nr:hypothetical protein Y032_0240g3345 [Ancylostoma ceylanicum]